MSKGGRIAIALMLGFMAALFGMLYLSSQRNQLLGSAEVVNVYIAAQDIKPNMALDKSMLATKAVPKAFLQPQSILVSEIDKSKVSGVTLVPIKEGEQILRTKLYEGAPPPLSADLVSRPNMVAVGIAMENLPHAIHGLIRPGDHVDVLASFKFEKTKEEDFTEIRPLYQNAEILAVNDRTANNVKIATEKTPAEQADKATKTVTLALPPAAAQQMILAQQLGNIWLLLRAPGDKSEHGYEIWNNERLLHSQFRLFRADNRDQMIRDLMKK